MRWWDMFCVLVDYNYDYHCVYTKPATHFESL